MKIRIVSIVLILALMIPMATMAFANEMAEEEQVAVEEIVVEEPAVFYLDGEPLYDVVAQCIGGTYYVTLASMMPLLDASAVVEENSGMATVTAEAVQVTEIVAEVTEEETAKVAEEAASEELAGVTEEAPAGELAGVAEEVSAEEPAGVTGEAPAEGPAGVTEETPAEEPAEVAEEAATGEGAEAEAVEEPTEVAAVVEVLDTLTLTAQVGNEYLVANGRFLYVSGGVIDLEGGVAVPIRVLAEALNLTVGFDSATGCVSLTGSEEVGYLEDGETYYSQDSLYWLSRIIYSESGNQPMAGKIAVGNVVLNRVDDPSFPDTIYDVIFQKNQFSPVSNGTIHNEPNESSVIAAKLVLDGAVVMENALFFNRAGINCYASRNRAYVATIGGHSFYA